jgi:hypothetical protein
VVSRNCRPKIAAAPVAAIANRHTSDSMRVAAGHGDLHRLAIGVADAV